MARCIDDCDPPQPIGEPRHHAARRPPREGKIQNSRRRGAAGAEEEIDVRRGRPLSRELPPEKGLDDC